MRNVDWILKHRMPQPYIANPDMVIAIFKCCQNSLEEISAQGYPSEIELFPWLETRNPFITIGRTHMRDTIFKIRKQDTVTILVSAGFPIDCILLFWY
jgi:hypothetical protein